MLRLMTVLLLMAATAAGQEPAADEPPEIRRYMVEVIVFTYAEEVSVGTEVFPPDAEVLDVFAPEETLLFEDTEPPARGEADEAEEPEAPAAEFILHLEDDFTLADVVDHLERLDVYEPIMHFAWTQVTLPEEETAPIDLAELAEPPPGLTGSLTLYLSRYLHLVVDLTLNEPPADPEPVAIEDSVFSFSSLRDAFASEEPQPGPVRFRIEENRIFKNGDLRYFDHPKFGVLAKITRVEEEEDELIAPSDEARELLGAGGQ